LIYTYIGDLIKPGNKSGQILEDRKCQYKKYNLSSILPHCQRKTPNGFQALREDKMYLK